jgi:hypothetical protein
MFLKVISHSQRDSYEVSGEPYFKIHLSYLEKLSISPGGE